MLFDERAEHRLAFRISASILAILIGVAVAISAFFYVLKQEGDREVLNDWLAFIVADSGPWKVFSLGKPEDIDRFYTSGRRTPPPFRNVIIAFDSGSFRIFGSLASAETGELMLEEEAFDAPFDRVVSDRNYVFLWKRLPDRSVYVYASSQGELEHWSREVLSIVIACLLFAVALYFLARRIARESIEPLKESLEVMGLYNRNIAHELRTPLAVLKSDLELASSEKTSSHIASAIEEAGSIEKIIDGLLFLAENRSTGKREPVKVAPEIRKKWEQLLKKHPDRNMELTLRAKAKPEGNPELISILVGILLENAFVHSKDGTTIAVSDVPNGIEFENEVEHEIPKSVLDHLFEPFIKFQSAWSGLGLPMARRIADIHGWGIRFDQSDGRVTVRLNFEKS